MTSEKARFLTTRWSLVRRAQLADAGGSSAESALQELCTAYWAPLYGFARRRGISEADAEDSTQSFFAALLGGGWLELVDRDRGRFRTYLLTLFQRHLASEWRREHTVKRGGKTVTVPLELAFDAADRVRQRYAARGQAELAESLKPLLVGAKSSEGVLDDIALQTGKRVATLRVTLHRLRERYREALYAEVAETVVSPEDVEAELDELLRALRGG